MTERRQLFLEMAKDKERKKMGQTCFVQKLSKL